MTEQSTIKSTCPRPSRADVILYYVNSVLEDGPPVEELRAAFPARNAVRRPTEGET